MSKRILFSIVILSIVLSACGGNPTTSSTEATQANNPLVFPTPLPTTTPTPTPEVRYSNGEELLLSGDYDAAFTEFQLTSTQTTDIALSTSSILGMGRALLLKRDYYGAYSQLSYLLNNFPSGETRNRSYFFLAKAYEALDQPRLAADAYASYLAALPGPLDSEINEMLGNALMEYGDFAGAVSAYETALTTASDSKTDQLHIELAQAVTETGDTDRAITLYLSLNETSQSGYYKSQANLLLGRIYTQMGMPEQAYARYQDSVEKYPEYTDSYSQLAALVNDGQSVNQLKRGITDYYAEQYGVAIIALDAYMIENPTHDAEAHVYKALSFYAMGEFENEIAEWDEVIAEHSSESEYFYRAFNEKSYTQWLSLNEYQEAAKTCLTFVASVPSSPHASEMLDKAARIYVDGGYLINAADTYERLFSEYPGSEEAYQGLFNAGILYFRQNDFAKAQLTFQRLIVLTENPEEQSAAYLWTAKSMEKQGNTTEANEYFQKAVDIDPTGYYGIRANQILNGLSPFPALQNIDLAVDFEGEKNKADRWMFNTFQLDSSTDLDSPGELASNAYWLRAEEYNKLGMRDEARNELEALRTSLIGDAVNTYRLMNRALELGFYRIAAYASRHVLDLAGLSQAATLTDPPVFFNHIRFGVFYRDYVVETALKHTLEPMLIFSVIRQESLFDSSVVSVASAQGLMQITPDTAAIIVVNYGWPENFITEDLNRPMVNIRLGVHYYKSLLDLNNGNNYSALASYNAGPTATYRWSELSGGDNDLFLEIINYSETKNYIKYIVENYSIYESIYTR